MLDGAGRSPHEYFGAERFEVMRRLCDGKRGGVLVLRYGTLLLSRHLAG